MANPIPFSLNGVTTKVTATTSSVPGTIAMNGQTTVMVTNTGSVTAFITSATSGAVATTSSTPVLAASAQSFTVPGDHASVAAIVASGTADVYFTVGSGQ